MEDRSTIFALNRIILASFGANFLISIFFLFFFDLFSAGIGETLSTTGGVMIIYRLIWLLMISYSAYVLCNSSSE